MKINHRYDAHCHIFTLKYALKEIKNMLHDMLHGTYPWLEPTQNSFKASSGKWDDLKELLQQLYELIHAAAGSEEGNLDFLQKEAKKAFPGSHLRIVPLMMDIFYMLAYPLEKDQDIKTLKTKYTEKNIELVDQIEFQYNWNEILDDFKAYVLTKKAPANSIIEAPLSETIDMTLQFIEEERSVQSTLLQMENSFTAKVDRGFYPTDGFCYHFDKLMNLVVDRNGELFPFVAIDPRRPGMIDTLLSGKFFRGKRKFFGVKLYPRMGYHPLCKPMDKVYQYCSDNNLPIIFHCGKRGFPPSTKWKYSDFGNPLNFEPVVKKYPNLKIDFAHMGSSDPSYEWADTIVRLVNENDNVYSDLSCYTHAEKLLPMKKYWDENPKLRTRLMFGTDFDVMYFTGEITMQNYYDNFKNTFSTDELEMLMQDNTIRFFQNDGINLI